MTREADISNKPNSKQSGINFVQYRLTPSVVIILFTFGMSFVRAYLVPEWGIGYHILGFLGQTTTMIGLWHLVKAINKRLDRRIPFENGPVKRIVAQVLICLSIMLPILVLVVTFARPHIPVYVNNQFLAIGFVLFTILICLFNFSFYTGYFFKHWQETVQDKADIEIEAAELQKEKLTLQYHQLRNQVNPHYLFNTLSSLDGLIHTDPELASEFVRHMAKVYRYVLQHKESEIVSLEEELDFIQHYIELLHIRYSSGLAINVDVSEEAKEKGIVMVTLQMLIDNAIKHNIVQVSTPLTIVIKDEADFLIVHNNKQLRKQVESSNKHGLIQLRQLYSYLTKKNIIVEETDTSYSIKIPLI
ncbi:MAG: sensor histidine kinase [Flavipsychrobacter sp.]